MNKTKLLISATLASAIVSCPLFAADVNVATPERTVPHAVKIVQPTDLPRHFTGRTIELEFTVNPQGRPVDIEVLTRVDRAIQRSVVTALAQWRFAPAYEDGMAVRQRVVMPLDLTVES